MFIRGTAIILIKVYLIENLIHSPHVTIAIIHYFEDVLSEFPL